MELVANFKLDRQTKGALRYMEVNSDGKVLDQSSCTVGTLYIRKAAYSDGEYPEAIRIQIQPI